MDTGIKSKYAAVLSVCFSVASVSIVAAQPAQKTTMDEVKRFIGPDARTSGQAKAVGQACDRYASASGIAFVDRHIRKVVQVQFTHVMPSRKDIGTEAARCRIMDWLKAHGVLSSNWRLDAQQRLDHGKAGIYYQFDWSKPGQAPIMHAVMTSAGEVKLWYRAEGGPQISRTPSVSATWARSIVEREISAKFGLRHSPLLMVRYLKGRYRLVWDIWMQALDDPLCTGAASVDAHTGELVDLFPLQRPKAIPGARTR